MNREIFRPEPYPPLLRNPSGRDSSQPRMRPLWNPRLGINDPVLQQVSEYIEKAGNTNIKQDNNQKNTTPLKRK